MGSVEAIGATQKVQDEGDERPRVHYVLLELGGMGSFISMCVRTIERDKPSLLASFSNKIVSSRESNSWQVRRAGSVAMKGDPLLMRAVDWHLTPWYLNL